MNPQLLYLVQTDTTVGFLSQNRLALAKAKGRDPSQPFLIATASFHELKKLSRVPKTFRKKVRRMRKTTFLYPNKKAIRVVKEGEHHRFLKRFDYLYSTSANRHSASFDLDYAKSVVDVIVEDASGFHESNASLLMKLGKKREKRVR